MLYDRSLIFEISKKYLGKKSEYLTKITISLKKMVVKNNKIATKNLRYIKSLQVDLDTNIYV